MTKEGLTESERKTYEFVSHRLIEGYCPTIREICAACEFKSTSTAQKNVMSLVEKGYLEKPKSRSHIIRLPCPRLAKVPLISSIEPGQLASEIEETNTLIDFSITKEKEYEGTLFALKVKDDSMIEASILKGDIVIVEQVTHVENGEIAVVAINKEITTIMRVYVEDGKYMLQSENKEIKPIETFDVEILGRIVSVVRYY